MVHLSYQTQGHQVILQIQRYLVGQINLWIYQLKQELKFGKKVKDLMMQMKATIILSLTGVQLPQYTKMFLSLRAMKLTGVLHTGDVKELIQSLLD